MFTTVQSVVLIFTLLQLGETQRGRPGEVEQPLDSEGVEQCSRAEVRELHETLQNHSQEVTQVLSQVLSAITSLEGTVETNTDHCACYEKACIDRLVVIAFTSNLQHAGADISHGVELRAGGINQTITLTNLPGDDYFPHKGDLWDLSLTSDFRFPHCVLLSELENVAIVAQNNDGWNIESITTLVCSYYCSLFTQDLHVNRWVDGDGETTHLRFDLTQECKITL